MWTGVKALFHINILAPEMKAPGSDRFVAIPSDKSSAWAEVIWLPLRSRTRAVMDEPTPLKRIRMCQDVSAFMGLVPKL